MKVAVFNTKSYDREFLEKRNAKYGHNLTFLAPQLSEETSILAAGFPAVCVFVNDQLNGETIRAIYQQGTRLIALRCAGYNNVDLAVAKELNMTVVRVPAYDPYGVAEHTVGLMLSLNRKIHRAYNRVRDNNFSIEGFLGYTMNGCTVGVIGTGKIGALTAKILKGFGCQLLGYDIYQNPECLALGMRYVELPELFSASNIITLHCPLTPETHHLINSETIKQMQDGVMLINTSRGGLIDTVALIEGLKEGKIGHLGLDVYEQEGDLFFENLSEEIITDDVFQRLLTFPNVLITSHQAFFTKEALTNIADVTLSNISDIEQGHTCANLVRWEGSSK